MTKASELKTTPRSKILQKGYINIYSELNAKEKQQIRFKTKYHENNPNWDESQVFLAKYLSGSNNDNLVVLDAGCGHGNYVIDENREKIDWAVGVDASPEATSRNICLDEIRHEDVGKTTLNNEAFDACVSLWLLEHLEDPDRVFLEIHRVLKKDGLFMFTTPNKNYIPLLLVRAVKSKLINHVVNKLLYGRKSEDIYESFYRANTLEDIKKLTTDKFEILELKYNYDPSYLSFGRAGYLLNNFISKIFEKMGNNSMKPHIISVLRKI